MVPVWVKEASLFSPGMRLASPKSRILADPSGVITFGAKRLAPPEDIKSQELSG